MGTLAMPFSRPRGVPREALFLSLTRDGRIADDRQLDKLEERLPLVTDCFLFCHGWLHDEAEARQESARFFALLDGVLAPLRERVVPLRLGLHWPSKPFADPDRLDVTRASNPHLGFGAGPHHCLGAALARMELQEALGGLLRRLPGLRLAVPEERLRFKPGLVVRSLESLPVTWEADGPAGAGRGPDGPDEPDR